jgi:hypothetical protein
VLVKYRRGRTVLVLVTVHCIALSLGLDIVEIYITGNKCPFFICNILWVQVKCGSRVELHTAHVGWTNIVATIFVIIFLSFFFSVTYFFHTRVLDFSMQTYFDLIKGWVKRIIHAFQTLFIFFPQFKKDHKMGKMVFSFSLHFQFSISNVFLIKIFFKTNCLPTKLNFIIFLSIFNFGYYNEKCSKCIFTCC